MPPKRRRLDIDSVLATATRTAESEATATRQPDTTSRGSGTLAHVPIDAIAPNKRNVRRTLLDVEELAESIASVGVLEPLVARPITDRERPQYERALKYIIVMGERRHAASTLAGLTTIPVVIRTDIAHDNEIKLMTVENLQRTDLNPIDEGLGYRQLIEELELSQRTVAKSRRPTNPRLPPDRTTRTGQRPPRPGRGKPRRRRCGNRTPRAAR